MKKLLITLFICTFAIFNMGCEALEEALKSQSGCMLKDAPNYNSASLLPCTTECIGEQTGSNCCCEEIIYGCMDENAPNYSTTANAPCVEVVSGIETQNACCVASIAGCMDQGANNYNSLATVSDEAQCAYDEAEVTLEDGSTIIVAFGCMNGDACNHVESATADCNQENAAIAGSDWEQNDDCCDLTLNSSCYLDLNNNGYYEEVNSSANTCNCAQWGVDNNLGVGWVSGDDVAENMEVQGCMSEENTGFSTVVDIGLACLEYDPTANVDNGGCCLTELTEEDLANPEFNLVGTYNMVFNMGWVDENGDCALDTMINYDDFGPDIDQVTLGAGGGFQHYVEYHDSFDSRPEWEYRAEGINSVDGCEVAADEMGADYWFCGNWGTGDFETCDDFYDQQGCISGPGCRWETNFCHPTFSGMPCNDINHAPEFEGMEEEECGWREDCAWDDETDQCFTPVWEPWMECVFLDEYECEYYMNENYDSHCKLATFDPTELACLDDCGDCIVDFYGEEGPTEEEMCTFASCMSGSACWHDCDDDLQDEFEMFAWLSYMCNAPEECGEMMMGDCEDVDGDGYCDDYECEDTDGDGYCDDEDGDGPPACIEDCDGVFDVDPDEDPMGFCNWVTTTLASPGCADNCEGEELSDVNEVIQKCTDCLDEDNCDDMVGGDDDGDGPPECMHDCPGINEMEEESFEGFCTWLASMDEICTDDCEDEAADVLTCLTYICDGCDQFDCSEMDSSRENEKQNKEKLFHFIRKIIEIPNHDSQLARGNNSSECEDEEIEDCKGDCAPANWVGDDYCDNGSYEYNGIFIDLNCSDFGYDGGDCDDENDEWDEDDISCIPNIDTYPCFGYDEYECMGDDCMWHGGDGMDDEVFCSPPIGNSIGVCQDIMGESECNAKVGECHWMMEGPDGAHCAPAPPDCFSKNNVDDCEASPNCEWNMPDWIDPWAEGACFKDDHCKSDPILNNNEDDCIADPGCEWVWAGEDTGCWEIMEDNMFCDCMLPFDKFSCEASGGSWELPPWAMEGDEWVEHECMMPMTEQDCYHNFDDQDPCAQDFSSGNEQTTWDDPSHTCTKSFVFSEAGIWSINAEGEFCIEWDNEEVEDPLCNTLITPDECNCFDCMWNGTTGSCDDWADDGNGRVSGQYLTQRYENIVEELSNNNDGECFEYEMVGSELHILIIDDGGGYCEEIIFSPATSGI